MVRKSIPRFTKSPSLVLIGLVLTEIQAFKNVKYLQRNVWKTGQIRTNVRICPVFHTFHSLPRPFCSRPIFRASRTRKLLLAARCLSSARMGTLATQASAYHIMSHGGLQWFSVAGLIPTETALVFLLSH